MELSFSSIEEAVKFLESIGVLGGAEEVVEKDVEIEEEVQEVEKPAKKSKGAPTPVVEEEEEKSSYEIGTKLSIKWSDGKTYAAEVIKGNKVRFEDETEYSLDSKSIKSITVVTEEVEEEEDKVVDEVEFKKGDKVKVLWGDDKWYAGSVDAKGGILFTDGTSTETDSDDVQDIQLLAKTDKVKKDGVVEVAEEIEEVEEEEEEVKPAKAVAKKKGSK